MSILTYLGVHDNIFYAQESLFSKDCETAIDIILTFLFFFFFEVHASTTESREGNLAKLEMHHILLPCREA